MNNLFLTPKDIHDKTFKRSFKGYDENEVDEFLDLIIKEFNIMIDENERLRQELIAKPIVQEYSNASANEIKRLETMLSQAIDVMQTNRQNNFVDMQDNNIKANEELAKEQEKNAKLNEFKKALESYKSNFEVVMDEQKKQLNDKYSEIITELNSLTGEKTIPQYEQEPPVFQMPESFAPPVKEVMQEAPEQPMSAEKPSFLLHNENPAGMIEKTILTIEKQTQQDTAQRPPIAQPQYAPAEQSVQRPQFLQNTQPPTQSAPPAQSAPPVPPAPLAPPVQQEPPKYQGIVNQAPTDSYEQNPVASDNRFKPNYSEYAWLYQERDALNKTASESNVDITFRNPREKEELKRLIDEVID